MGISLAMAGARVTLTDLPHITPLTAQNLALNADRHSLDAQVNPVQDLPAPECLRTCMRMIVVPRAHGKRS